MAEDKKKKKFNSGSAFKNYAKNLGQSSVNLTDKILFDDDALNSVKEFKETNSEFFSDSINLAKEYKKVIAGIKSAFNENIVKNFNELKSNVAEDLKSGNLYNKKRADKQMNDRFLGDDEFGGLSDDFEKDFNDFSESTTSTLDDIKGSMDDFSNSMSDTLSDFSDDIVSSNEKTTVFAVNSELKMHKQSMSGLGALGSGLGSLISFNNNNLNPFLDKAMDYYDRSLEIKEETNNLIREMAESSKAILEMYQTQQQEQTDFTSQLESIGGTGFGSFNLEEYGKVIGKNITNALEEVGISFNKDSLTGGTGNQIAQFIANPIGIAVEAGIKKALPAAFKESLKSFNKSLDAFIPSLFLKINKTLSDDTEMGFFKRKILEMFNVNSKISPSVDISNYKKTQIPFDGVTKKAIVDVIPMYLRKILSAVSKSDEILFDYNSGKAVQSKEVAAQYKQLDDTSFLDFYKSREKMTASLEQFGLQMEEMNSITKDFDNIFKAIRDSGKLFTGKEKISDIGYTGSESSLKLFNTLFGKMSKSDKLAFQQEIVNAINSRQSNYDMINNNLDGNPMVQYLMDNDIIPRTRNSRAKKGRPANTINYKGKSFKVKSKDEALKRYDELISQINSIEGNLDVNPKALEEFRKRREKESARLAAKKNNEKFDEAKFEEEYNRRNSSDSTVGRINKLKNNVNSKIEGNTLTQAIKKAIDKPFNFLGKQINKLDTFLYNIIFGKEDDPNSIKNKLSSYFQDFKERLFGKDGVFTDFRQSFTEKVIEPLKEYRDKFKHFLFNDGKDGSKVGILTNIGNSLKNIGNSFINNMFGRGYIDAKTGNFIDKKEKPIMETFKKSLLSVSENVSTYLLGKKTGMVTDKGKAIRDNSGLFSRVSKQFSDLLVRSKVFLFGEKDADGNFLTKGKISPEMQAAFKKYAPSTSIGAGAGVLGSLFLPGGPFIGMLFGGALGFIHKLDSVQDFLYGKLNIDGIREYGLMSRFKDALKQKSQDISTYLFGKDGKGGTLDMSKNKFFKGAGFGAGAGILGSLFLPGGPILGSLVGAAAGIASQSKKFQTFLFGTKDISEDSALKRDGLFGVTKNFLFEKVLNPLRDTALGTFNFMKEWINKKIVTPFRLGFKPLTVEISYQTKKAFKGILNFVKDSWTNFMDTMSEKAQDFFQGKFNQYVWLPLLAKAKSGLSALGSAIGNAIAKPFHKFMEFGDRLRVKHADKGLDDYAHNDSAYARLVAGRKSNQLDEWNKEYLEMNGSLKDYIEQAKQKRLAGKKELEKEGYINPFNKDFDVEAYRQRQAALNKSKRFDDKELKAAHQKALDNAVKQKQSEELAERVKTEKKTRSKANDALKDVQKNAASTVSERIQADNLTQVRNISSKFGGITNILKSIRDEIIKSRGGSSKDIKRLNSKLMDKEYQDELESQGIYTDDIAKAEDKKLDRIFRKNNKLITNAENQSKSKDDNQLPLGDDKNPVKVTSVSATSVENADSAKTVSQQKESLAQREREDLETRSQEANIVAASEQKTTNKLLDGVFGKSGIIKKIVNFGKKLLLLLPALIAGIAGIKKLIDTFKDQSLSGLGSKIASSVGSLGKIAISPGGPLNRFFSRSLVKAAPHVGSAIKKAYLSSPYVKALKEPLFKTKYSKAFGKGAMNEALDNLDNEAVERILASKNTDIFSDKIAKEWAENSLETRAVANGVSTATRRGQRAFNRSATKLSKQASIKANAFKIAKEAGEDAIVKPSVISKTLQNIVSSPTMTKTIGKFQIGKDALDKISKQASKSMVKSGSSTAINKRLIAAASKQAGNVLLFGVDAARGFNEANRIFSLPSSVEPTFSMKASAAVGKALSELTFGLVDPGWISSVIYNSAASDKDKTKLLEAQKLMKEEVARANGFDVSDFESEDEEVRNRAKEALKNYNTKVNKTAMQKLADWTRTDGGKTIARAGTRVGSFLAPGIAGAVGLGVGAMDTKGAKSALGLNNEANLTVLGRAASGFSKQIDYLTFGLLDYNKTIKPFYGALLLLKDGIIKIKDKVVDFFKWIKELPEKLGKFLNENLEGKLAQIGINENLIKPISDFIRTVGDGFNFVKESIDYVFGGIAKTLGLDKLKAKATNKGALEVSRQNLEAIKAKQGASDTANEQVASALRQNAELQSQYNAAQSRAEYLAAPGDGGADYTAGIGGNSLDSEYAIASQDNSAYTGIRGSINTVKSSVSGLGNVTLKGDGSLNTPQVTATNNNVSITESVLKSLQAKGGVTADPNTLTPDELSVAQQILEKQIAIQEASNSGDTTKFEELTNSDGSKLIASFDSDYAKNLEDAAKLVYGEIDKTNEPISTGKKIGMGIVGSIAGYPMLKFFKPVFKSVLGSFKFLLTPVTALLKKFGVLKSKDNTKLSKTEKAADVLNKAMSKSTTLVEGAADRISKEFNSVANNIKKAFNNSSIAKSLKDNKDDLKNTLGKNLKGAKLVNKNDKDNKNNLPNLKDKLQNGKIKGASLVAKDNEKDIEESTKSFKNSIKKVQTEVSNTVKKAGEQIDELGNNIKKKATSTGKTIKEGTKAITKPLDNIGSEVNKEAKSTSKKLDKSTNTIKNSVKKQGADIDKEAKSTSKKIKTSSTSIKDSVKKQGTDIDKESKSTSKKIKNGTKTVGTELKNLGENTKDAATAAAQEMKTGSKLVQKISKSKLGRTLKSNKGNIKRGLVLSAVALGGSALSKVLSNKKRSEDVTRSDFSDDELNQINNLQMQLSSGAIKEADLTDSEAALLQLYNNSASNLDTNTNNTVQSTLKRGALTALESGALGDTAQNLAYIVDAGSSDNGENFFSNILSNLPFLATGSYTLSRLFKKAESDDEDSGDNTTIINNNTTSGTTAAVPKKGFLKNIFGMGKDDNKSEIASEVGSTLANDLITKTETDIEGSIYTALSSKVKGFFSKKDKKTPATDPISKNIKDKSKKSINKLGNIFNLLGKKTAEDAVNEIADSAIDSITESSESAAKKAVSKTSSGLFSKIKTKFGEKVTGRSKKSKLKGKKAIKTKKGKSKFSLGSILGTAGSFLLGGSDDEEDDDDDSLVGNLVGTAADAIKDKAVDKVGDVVKNKVAKTAGKKVAEGATKSVAKKGLGGILGKLFAKGATKAATTTAAGAAGSAAAGGAAAAGGGGLLSLLGGPVGIAAALGTYAVGSGVSGWNKASKIYGVSDTYKDKLTGGMKFSSALTNIIPFIGDDTKKNLATGLYSIFGDGDKLKAMQNGVSTDEYKKGMKQKADNEDKLKKAEFELETKMNDVMTARLESSKTAMSELDNQKEIDGELKNQLLEVSKGTLNEAVATAWLTANQNSLTKWKQALGVDTKFNILSGLKGILSSAGSGMAKGVWFLGPIGSAIGGAIGVGKYLWNKLDEATTVDQDAQQSVTELTNKTMETWKAKFKESIPIYDEISSAAIFDEPTESGKTLRDSLKDISVSSLQEGIATGWTVSNQQALSEWKKALGVDTKFNIVQQLKNPATLILGTIGGIAGTFLGGPLGTAAGAALGGALGSFLSDNWSVDETAQQSVADLTAKTMESWSSKFADSINFYDEIVTYDAIFNTPDASGNNFKDSLGKIAITGVQEGLSTAWAASNALAAQEFKKALGLDTTFNKAQQITNPINWIIGPIGAFILNNLSVDQQVYEIVGQLTSKTLDQWKVKFMDSISIFDSITKDTDLQSKMDTEVKNRLAEDSGKAMADGLAVAWSKANELAKDSFEKGINIITQDGILGFISGGRSFLENVISVTLTPLLAKGTSKIIDAWKYKFEAIFLGGPTINTNSKIGQRLASFVNSSGTSYGKSWIEEKILEDDNFLSDKKDEIINTVKEPMAEVAKNMFTKSTNLAKDAFNAEINNATGSSIAANGAYQNAVRTSNSRINKMSEIGEKVNGLITTGKEKIVDAWVNKFTWIITGQTSESSTPDGFIGPGVTVTGKGWIDDQILDNDNFLTDRKEEIIGSVKEPMVDVAKNVFDKSSTLAKDAFNAEISKANGDTTASKGAYQNITGSAGNRKDMLKDISERINDLIKESKDKIIDTWVDKFEWIGIGKSNESGETTDKGWIETEILDNDNFLSDRKTEITDTIKEPMIDVAKRLFEKSSDLAEEVFVDKINTVTTEQFWSKANSKGKSEEVFDEEIKSTVVQSTLSIIDAWKNKFSWIGTGVDTNYKVVGVPGLNNITTHGKSWIETEVLDNDNFLSDDKDKIVEILKKPMLKVAEKMFEKSSDLAEDQWLDKLDEVGDDEGFLNEQFGGYSLYDKVKSSVRNINASMFSTIERTLEKTVGKDGNISGSWLEANFVNDTSIINNNKDKIMGTFEQESINALGQSMDASAHISSLEWSKSVTSVLNEYGAGSLGFSIVSGSMGTDASMDTSAVPTTEGGSLAAESIKSVSESIIKVWANKLKQLSSTLDQGLANSEAFNSGDLDAIYSKIVSENNNLASYNSSIKIMDFNTSGDISGYLSGADSSGDFGGFKQFIFYSKRLMGYMPMLISKVSTDVGGEFNSLSSDLSTVMSTLQSSLSSAKSMAQSGGTSGSAFFSGSPSGGGKYSGLNQAAYYMGKVLLYPLYIFNSLNKQIQDAYNNIQFQFPSVETTGSGEGMTASIKWSGLGGSGTSTKTKSKSHSKLPQSTKSAYYDGFGGKGEIEEDKEYSQKHNLAVSTKSYAGSTMSTSGCGPMAAAKALSLATGKRIDPYNDVAKYNEEHGFASKAEGTNSKFIYGLAKKYNSDVVNINPDDQAMVDEQLSEGNPILANGIRNYEVRSPYTKSGHYITITGKKDDGRYIVEDPNGKSGLYNWRDIGYGSGDDPYNNATWKGARAFYSIQNTDQDAETNGASSKESTNAPFMLNGMKYYAQGDPQWSGTSYGSSTVGKGGCGPTSAAMVVSSYQGKEVTPAEAARISVQNGGRVEGAGSANDVATRIGRNFGLKGNNHNSKLGSSDAKRYLSAKVPIVTSGRGTNTPYSMGGHFVVLTGMTKDGKIVVNDGKGYSSGSGMTASKQSYTLDYLNKYMTSWDPISKSDGSGLPDEVVIDGKSSKNYPNLVDGSKGTGSSNSGNTKRITIGEKLVEVAKTQLGVPYVWGGDIYKSGNSGWSKGLDCSGFTQGVYVKSGIPDLQWMDTKGHMVVSEQHSKAKKIISLDQAQPGDLVFRNPNGHVGMYIGNNEYIHAPQSGDVVKISKMPGSFNDAGQMPGVYDDNGKQKYIDGGPADSEGSSSNTTTTTTSHGTVSSAVGSLLSKATSGVLDDVFKEKTGGDKTMSEYFSNLTKSVNNLVDPEIQTTETTTTDSGNTSSSDNSTDNIDLSKGKTITLPDKLGKYKTYMGWQCITDTSSEQYKLRKAAQNFDSEGFGKIGNRYVLAMTNTYGKIGDYVSVKQQDGTYIHGILGDMKHTGKPVAWDPHPANKWGHENGQIVVEFVVDKNKWYSGGRGSHANPGTANCHPEWSQYVTSVTNTGNYWDKSSSGTAGNGFGGFGKGPSQYSKIKAVSGKGNSTTGTTKTSKKSSSKFTNYYGGFGDNNSSERRYSTTNKTEIKLEDFRTKTADNINQTISASRVVASGSQYGIDEILNFLAKIEENTRNTADNTAITAEEVANMKESIDNMDSKIVIAEGKEHNVNVANIEQKQVAPQGNIFSGNFPNQNKNLVVESVNKIAKSY